MPNYSISQLKDKTIYLIKPVSFYRAYDVSTSQGSNAKPVGTLANGYSFVLDSYLAPTPAYTDAYGILRPERKYSYWLFYGKDKKYYAIKFDPNAFSQQKLKQQGALTIEEEKAAEAEANKSELEKATDKIAAFFGSTGKVVRNVVYIGLAVWAAGYLIPKIKNK